jgi:hypothetical protein
MINRILCAIDFSEATPSVLRYAAKKAELLKVPMMIIFSYRLRDYGKVDDIRNVKLAIEENAQEYFALLEQETLKSHELPYQFSIEVGFLSDRIESHILRDRNTLVIISEKLATDLNEVTDDHFFEKLQIPVEFVPEVNSLRE